jgi:tetratricopeptide (TPR) repeat protein
VLLQLERYDEAIAALELAGVGSSFRGQLLGTLALANAAAGRPEAAQRVFEQLTDLSRREYVSAAGFVYAWLGLGDHGQALDALNEALETRSAGLMGVLLDPRLDPLRGAAGFQEVLRRMNLG